MNRFERKNKNDPVIGQSLILGLLNTFFAMIGRLAQNSFLLGSLCHYDEAENLSKRSLVGKFWRKLSILKKPFLQFKLHFAQKSQESLLINFFEARALDFFRTNLRSLGIFLFAYGGILVSVTFANSPEKLRELEFSDTFLFGVATILVSFFFMPFKNKSIAESLHDSKLASYLLFDVFSLKHIAPAMQSGILPTSGGALFMGLVAGIVSYTVSPWVFIITVFVVAVMYIVFTKPENGVLLICLLLPFLEIKLLIYFMSMTVLSLAFKILRGKRALHFNLCSGILVLIGTMLLSGSVRSYDAENAGRAALAFGMVILFSLCVIALVRSSGLAEKCFRMLSISSLLAAAYGISKYVFLFFANRDLADTLTALFENGMVSSFRNANIFAAFLIAMIPLLFIRHNSGSRLTVFVSLFVLCSCLAFTNSYYAILSIVVVFVVAMVFFSKYGLAAAGISVCTIAFFKFFMPNTGMITFDQYMRSFEITTKLTQTNYDGILEFFRNLWYSGAGLGSESIAGASALIAGEITGYSGYGNSYINIMMKIGVPLVIFSLILLLVFLSRLISYIFDKTKSETARNSCSMLVFSICTLLVFAFYVDLTESIQIISLFFLLLALGSAVTDSADNDYISPFREYELYGREGRE